MSAADPSQVQVIRPGQTYVGKQGFTYGAGASAETVGARHICMNVLPMPPGARAKAHYHERIETIAYMLEGECVVRFGDRMQHEVLVRQGDHAFVPADLPHAPCNESRARRAGGWTCTHPAAIRRASRCCPARRCRSVAVDARRLGLPLTATPRCVHARLLSVRLPPTSARSAC